MIRVQNTKQKNPESENPRFRNSIQVVRSVLFTSGKHMWRRRPARPLRLRQTTTPEFLNFFCALFCNFKTLTFHFLFFFVFNLILFSIFKSRFYSLSPFSSSSKSCIFTSFQVSLCLRVASSLLDFAESPESAPLNQRAPPLKKANSKLSRELLFYFPCFQIAKRICYYPLPTNEFQQRQEQQKESTYISNR